MLFYQQKPSSDGESHQLEQSSHQHKLIVEGLSFAFVINSKAVDQTYTWSTAGLSLHFPTGPLSQDLHGKKISLRTDSTGPFHLPPDATLVSAVFGIETDVSIDARLEIEHCYRGDPGTLAFVCCEDHQPPYKFKLVSCEDQQVSFSSTHGSIQTSHFSHWAIVWLTELLFGKSEEIRIKVPIFYRVEATHLKVYLVIFKDLSARFKVHAY